MKPPGNKASKPTGRQNPRARSARAFSKAKAASRDASRAPGSSSLPPQLVQIEKPIYGGAFLARVEGKAVFVPLTLPGEQARVRIVEEKPSYEAAEAEEILTAAPQRVAPLCPHFGPCGGCHYQHADYASQLTFKQQILRETLERGGVPAPPEIAILAGEPWAYRNRIRLAFDAAGNPGYRGRRSHAIVPIAECPIAAPLLVKAAREFAPLARRLAPALRPSEIALFCDAEQTALLVSVFLARPAKIGLDGLARALKDRVPALAGLELAAEGRNGRPSQTLAQWGEESLVYHAAGFGYRVDRGAFFQVNRGLVDALVERVCAGRSGNAAWDLFAGVGLFARRLTRSFDRVAAVESAPAALPALEYNLKGTTGAAIHAAARAFLGRGAAGPRPDFIALDPPRAGLGADAAALLAEIAAPALTYVSCDPATLARDLRTLIASGYRVERVTLADLFPQTFHIETIVDLRR